MRNNDDSAPLAWLTGRRFGLVIIGVVTLCFILLAANLITSGSNKASTSNNCLTAADFTDLTGQAFEGELSPADNFYTYSVYFKNNDTYVDTAAAKKILHDFGKFYKNHRNRSIIFSVSSDYASADDAALAPARLDRLTSDLNAAGVNKDAILTPAPKSIDDDEGVETPFATITITSSKTCK